MIKKIITGILQIKNIIKKNIKRLISSKLSASTVIFGPLILIFLMGLAFQGSGFSGVKVSVHSPEYNNISNTLIESMKDTDFEIYIEETKNQCIQNVKDGKHHLCIEFPQDFENGKMEFYVDFSRMNIVYSIISKLSTEVNRLSSDISMGATEDMLSIIGEASRTLSNSTTHLQTLRDSTDNLTDTLNQIANKLDNFSLGQEASKISNSNTTDVADSAKTNLENLKTAMVSTRELLEENIPLIEEQIESINQIITMTECQDKQTTECEFLKEQKQNLETQKTSVEEMLENTNTVIQEATKMQIALENTLNTIEIEKTEAVNNLLEGEQTKNEVTQGLRTISTTAQESKNSIAKMEEGINIISSQFEEISLTDAEKVIKPISTKINSLTTKKINTLEILFPAIIIMVMLFEGILLGNTLVMREKTSKANFRNKIMPVREYIFIIGTYITATILTLLQAFIVILIGIVIFGVSLTFTTANFFIVILLSIILFTSIGMIIGYLTNSEETAILIAVILAIILLMFSNLVIPLETMEATIGQIAKFTPFNLSEEVIRRTLIFGAEVRTDPVIIIAYLLEVIALLIATVKAHYYSAKQR